MLKKKAAFFLLLNCCKLYSMLPSPSQSDLWRKSVCSICCGETEEAPRPLSQIIADYPSTRQGLDQDDCAQDRQDDHIKNPECASPAPARNYKFQKLKCGHIIHACCLVDRISSKNLLCGFCQQKFDRASLQIGQFHKGQEDFSNARRGFIKAITPRVDSPLPADINSKESEQPWCLITLCCKRKN